MGDASKKVCLDTKLGPNPSFFLWTLFLCTSRLQNGQFCCGFDYFYHLFNTVFLYLIKILRRKKHMKKMHQLYGIERANSAGFCVIFFVGLLDILKSFFLIWPANVMPIWLFISVLQLKIPLNLVLRTCCIEELSNYKITWISSLVIFVGFFINMLVLTKNQEDQYGND